MSINAFTGSTLHTKGWIQEAALRMLMNNLDSDVAEDPENLVVYGGRGKAARNHECYVAIVNSLKTLENNETLLVQSGKPVGILRTHEEAPRVLIANSNLVPHWANWDHFNELEQKGLMMYGQMTAGSWIYIGSQGILQGTYETFVACGKKYFDGNLNGRFILSAGLGGMGGAQPLAATMTGATFLGVEVDERRIQKRLESGYVDEVFTNPSDAIKKALHYKNEGINRSIALLGNAADVYSLLVEEGIVPDIVTDQTSAHDPLVGYIPQGYSIEDAKELREKNPKDYLTKSLDSICIHVNAMIALQDMGAIVFDYGNNIREQAKIHGCDNAYAFPGFVPAFIRPLFFEGKGPFRWVALSGDPEDIYTTDRAILDAFPEDLSLCNWIKKAQSQVKFQGLPSRICWLGYGQRAKAGLIFNQLVAEGNVKAPIVIGRDHLDCGSVASPNRETEAMKDGSDAVADWPLLNALINSVNGASWVSLHHGGGVGMGYSIHAGQVIVADGTDAAAKRIERVLTSDPAMGILRHADAGYEGAIDFAKEHGVKIPMSH